MLAGLDGDALGRLWFPLGEQTKEQTRAEASAAGLAAARRPESQEACFLGGDDYRDFLARHGLAGERGAVVDEDGRELGTHDGLLALHARPAPRARRRGGRSRSTRSAPTRRRTPSSRARARALARTRVEVRGRLRAPAGRVEAKLRYRSPAVAATVTRRPDGFALALDEPAYGVARARPPCSTTATRSSARA